MCLFLSWLLACGKPPPSRDVAPAPPADPPAEPAPPPEPDPPPEPVVVTVAAVGDVLPHRAVKATATERGWGWVFEHIAPLVSEVDIAFANLEGPLAPNANKGVYDEVFNAPADLADGLEAAGFDVVSLANNHAWDQGVDGLLETLGNLERVGLPYLGAGRTCAAAHGAWVTEVRGVKVAFLAAVDLINFDLNAGADAPCVFVAGPECTADCGPDRDAIHFSLDEERLVAAVHAARAQADFVVMSFHWGNEYRTVPLPEYPALARVLVREGVDLVLGHHPHMLQPMERITEGDREGVAIYSLGNFVSNMAASYDPAKNSASRGNLRDGGILLAELIREPDGATHLGRVELVPTWTDNNYLARGDDPHLVRVVPHSFLRARLASSPDEGLESLLDLRLKTIREVVGEAWVTRTGVP